MHGAVGNNRYCGNALKYFLPVIYPTRCGWYYRISQKRGKKDLEQGFYLKRRAIKKQ